MRRNNRLWYRPKSDDVMNVNLFRDTNHFVFCKKMICIAEQPNIHVIITFRWKKGRKSVDTFVENSSVSLSSKHLQLYIPIYCSDSAFGFHLFPYCCYFADQMNSNMIPLPRSVSFLLLCVAARVNGRCDVTPVDGVAIIPSSWTSIPEYVSVFSLRILFLHPVVLTIRTARRFPFQ